MADAALVEAHTRVDEGGVRLVIRARPKSRPERLERAGDQLVLRVAAAPTDGEANQRIVALLAARLGIAKGRVSLVRGHTARDKELLIDGLALAAVRAALVAD